MGKSIIVNGADFSTNAIDVAPLPSSLDITSLLPELYPGHIAQNTTGEIVVSNSRTTLQSFLDITELKAQYRFTHIRVECLIEGVSAVPYVVGDTQSAGTWTATSWPLGNHTEVTVNFNSANLGVSTTAEAVTVTLYREE